MNKIVICPNCSQKVFYDELNRPTCPSCKLITEDFFDKYTDSYKTIVNSHLFEIKNRLESNFYTEALDEINRFINKSLITSDSASYYMFDLFKILATLKLDYNFETGYLKVYDKNIFSNNNYEIIIREKLLKYQDSNFYPMFDNLLLSIKEYQNNLTSIDNNYDIYFITDSDKELDVLTNNNYKVFLDRLSSNKDDYIKHQAILNSKYIIVLVNDAKNRSLSNYLLSRVNNYRKTNLDQEIILIKTPAYESLETLERSTGYNFTLPKLISNLDEALNVIKVLEEHGFTNEYQFLKRITKVNEELEVYKSRSWSMETVSEFDNLLNYYESLVKDYNHIYGNLPSNIKNVESFLTLKEVLIDEMIKTNNEKPGSDGFEIIPSSDPSSHIYQYNAILGYHNNYEYEFAFELLKKLAEDNYPKAQYLLALYYTQGLALKKSDNEQANYWFLKAAENNYDLAQVYLGYNLNLGIGIKQNLEEAFSWFLKASENNNMRALYNVGVMYEEGRGVNKSLDEAFKYYQKAMDEGHLNAYYKVAMFLINDINKRDYKKSFELLNEASHKNNQNAMFELANSYLMARGTNYDFKAGLTWYKRAAKLGNDKALNMLGYLYQHGINLDVDMEKAFNYYKKASESGNADALNNLGYLYQKGYYVDKNIYKAVHYYKEASEKGSKEALCNLGVCYYTGRGVNVNYELAVEYFEKARLENIAEAYYHLAVAYKEGKGVLTNTYKSSDYLNKAKALGLNLKLEGGLD